jgi:hypothetical protein
MGEATHGTHEFYRLRAELRSPRLIVDKGFDAVAVEADWPDALRADSGRDRFVLPLRHAPKAFAKGSRRRGWDARSASSAGPTPSAGAIASAPRCRPSSTLSCTSTPHVR